ncbi:MAG TPA: Uma2 family endonuclease [Egibacteraceae bacterium]|nr:Uma2 family endonuclease [Actinomycetota bacterium]HWB70836.1 Uma2 family endonuclease [Egibacteraceae bacterium]
MRIVVSDPLPSPVAEWLEQRRALGQDLFDEVWEGEYHVAPAPRASHGYLDDQVAALLRPRARARGLWPHGPLNIGHEDDYRVPDRAYLREHTDKVFVPTAAIVVEIVSPGDDSYRKFDFYFAHDVEELLIVDPLQRSVQWYGRGPQVMARTHRSTLLDLTEAALAELIDWPRPDPV